MPGGLLKSLRTVSDPTRARLLLLLDEEELSVAELQEILARGQSQISTHLSQLKQAGLVEDRRTGKNIFYRAKKLPEFEPLHRLLQETAGDIPGAAEDREALALVLTKRQDKVRSYFDSLAGRFGREYLPGRSWQGLAEILLSLLCPMVIADLGAGEGTFSQLLARRARRVIAIDSSPKMVEIAERLAREHGLTNVEFRVGDMESVPVPDSEVDLAFFSQSLHHSLHPERAVMEAYRILRPGGHIAILDLLRHNFEKARELYADVWLGFTEVELRRFLVDACFKDVQTAVVHREAEPPYFETVSALGVKGAVNSQ
ncbi:MAG: ArsR family transcriptional regulator [Acidobacteriaceae bacterium]|nr:ArsR family transcriptional regulator [Acidobacteriaceae bacterium]